MLVMNPDENPFLNSQPPVDNDHVQEGHTLFTPEEISLNSAQAPHPELPESVSTPPIQLTPPSASDVIHGVKSEGDPFLDWMIDSSLSFLDLADLAPVKTVEALRGLKEEKIRDKIQMANSVVVLMANYGSETDNEALVAACGLYAEKMKTIIKRLCL